MPSGASAQLRSGETSSPSQLNRPGMGPPSGNAVLVKVKDRTCIWSPPSGARPVSINLGRVPPGGFRARTTPPTGPIETVRVGRSGTRPDGPCARPPGSRPRSKRRYRRSARRARMATPTSAPPSSRARRANRRRSSARPPGRPRRGPRARGRRMRAAGVDGAPRPQGMGPRGGRFDRDRLVEAHPWRIAEECPEAPSGADLDRRERPAELAESRSDGLAPGRGPRSPRRARRPGRAPSSPRPRRVVPRSSPRPPRPRSGRRRLPPGRRSPRSGSSPGAGLRQGAPRPAIRRSRRVGRSSRRPLPRGPMPGAAATRGRSTSVASRGVVRAGPRRRAHPRD